MLGQIRTLEGVDVDSLKVNAFEGCMAEGAPHKVPEPVATGPVSEGSTAYHGNCHCGAVAYTLLAPQKISKVTWCNCSICSRVRPLFVKFTVRMFSEPAYETGRGALDIPRHRHDHVPRPRVRHRVYVLKPGSVPRVGGSSYPSNHRIHQLFLGFAKSAASQFMKDSTTLTILGRH